VRYRDVLKRKFGGRERKPSRSSPSLFDQRKAGVGLRNSKDNPGKAGTRTYVKPSRRTGRTEINQLQRISEVPAPRCVQRFT
jgi:hypothetical protein